ncbi:MAG: hypothetical protein QW666_00930 [Candidatus Woesearchaeota archaeon]
MKKTITLIILMICLVLISGFSYAESLCTDNDDGKDYDRKGSVKYGVTSEEDRCVLSPKADVRTETSLYLKEYYCSSDTRQSIIIDCSREGYERCYQGACIGGTKGGSIGNTTNVTQVPSLPICGDKKVNQYAEQCDPPGKICYTENFEIGICSATCQCDVKLKATGGLINKTENATTNTTTQANATQPKEEPKTEVPAEKPKEESKEEIKEEPKEEPKEAIAPIKEAAKPKGFFAMIWHWIKGLFS